MKHTPGPWQIGRYDDIVDASGEIIRAKGLALTRGDEAEANSRLIAAAPEMLAALKDAMRSTRKDFKTGADGDRQHREAWAEQFDAIAKAEGRP